MYTIQTNASGTRSMEISEVNLQTIQKYSLFQHLIDSNGIVDEQVLDKLKLNIRSLIASADGNCKDLLDLCIDVIYHNNMKAFGLHQLLHGHAETGGSLLQIRIQPIQIGLILCIQRQTGFLCHQVHGLYLVPVCQSRLQEELLPGQILVIGAALGIQRTGVVAVECFVCVIK